MTRAEADTILQEAEKLNAGLWIAHSYNVAKLAEKIAARAGMDSDKAYIWGLLHDIGRRNGVMQARHAIEGYYYLKEIGFDEGARICLTHTFQFQDVEGIYDVWDCTDKEKQFVELYLRSVIYDDYDKLIQLCDALSLTGGYCYAEKKMVKSVLKFGFKETTVNKWKAILELKEYFDKKIGEDVYILFEGDNKCHTLQ